MAAFIIALTVVIVVVVIAIVFIIKTVKKVTSSERYQRLMRTEAKIKNTYDRLKSEGLLEDDVSAEELLKSLENMGIEEIEEFEKSKREEKREKEALEAKIASEATEPVTPPSGSELSDRNVEGKSCVITNGKGVIKDNKCTIEECDEGYAPSNSEAYATCEIE